MKQIIPNEDGHVLRLMARKPGIVPSGTIVLAMSCRERTLARFRYENAREYFTAVQLAYVSEGYMVGRRVIILGSGDIGLIMTAHGSRRRKVLACVSGGLAKYRAVSSGLRYSALSLIPSQESKVKSAWRKSRCRK